LQLPRDEVEERRLASPVGPDDEAALAVLHAQVEVPGHLQTPECFRETLDRKCRHVRPPRGGSAALRAERPCQPAFASRTDPGTSPSGMKLMMATKIKPSTRFQRST